MINFEDRLRIQCPECGKLICTMKLGANPEGIYFWCSRCKKEFELKEEKKYRAHEANI